jgi:hypothetical protein
VPPRSTPTKCRGATPITVNDWLLMTIGFPITDRSPDSARVQ